MCTHKLEVERTPIAVMCPRAKKKRFYEAIGRQAMQASCNQAQKRGLKNLKEPKWTRNSF